MSSVVIALANATNSNLHLLDSDTPVSPDDLTFKTSSISIPHNGSWHILPKKYVTVGNFSSPLNQGGGITLSVDDIINTYADPSIVLNKGVNFVIYIAQNISSTEVTLYSNGENHSWPIGSSHKNTLCIKLPVYSVIASTTATGTFTVGDPVSDAVFVGTTTNGIQIINPGRGVVVKKSSAGMSRMWIIILLVLFAILIFFGVRQYKKHKSGAYISNF